jgi:hypothetical protein
MGMGVAPEGPFAFEKAPAAGHGPFQAPGPCPQFLIRTKRLSPWLKSTAPPGQRGPEGTARVVRTKRCTGEV